MPPSSKQQSKAGSQRRGGPSTPGEGTSPGTGTHPDRTSSKVGGGLAKFAAAQKEPPKNWKEKYVELSSPDTAGLPELPEGWCWATAEQLSDEVRAITYGVVKLSVILFLTAFPLFVRATCEICVLNLMTLSQNLSFHRRPIRALFEGGELLFTVRGTLGGIAVALDECRGWNVSREVAMLAPVDRQSAR